MPCGIHINLFNYYFYIIVILCYSFSKFIFFFLDCSLQAFPNSSKWWGRGGGEGENGVNQKFCRGREADEFFYRVAGA